MITLTEYTTHHVHDDMASIKITLYYKDIVNNVLTLVEYFRIYVQNIAYNIK